MKLLTVTATCFHNPSHHHTNHDTVYQLCPNQKVDTAAKVTLLSSQLKVSFTKYTEC